MLKKLGLASAIVASVFVLGVPTHAGQSPASPADTSTAPAEEPESEETSPPLTALELPAATTTTTVAPLNPAEVGNETPSRGTQNQIAEPPPPPTTLPPWDPFRLPANSGSGRRAVYSISNQTVWALDSNEQIIKMHRVSGKQTGVDPRPGTYSVWGRSRYTYSINNPTITWGYMVRFAHGARGGNIGFHEIPFQYGKPVQSISQLGQALSGGCVRQALPDAQWMWAWAQIGTKVVVLP